MSLLTYKIFQPHRLEMKPKVDFVRVLKEARLSYGYNTLVFDYQPIISKLKLDQYHEVGGKTDIIDLYPTIGSWSDALNRLVKPKTHLMLEPHVGFRESLKETIAHTPEGNYKLYGDDPFLWESFSKYVGENKVIDPVKYDRGVIHPQLILTANLAYPRGGILLSQWMHTILNSNWVQTYGSVRMLIWCYQQQAAKMIPKPSEKNRSKTSVILELTSDTEVVFSTPPVKYLFSDDYLADHSPIILNPLITGRSSRLLDLCLLDIKPKVVPIEHTDEWDYLTKQLFIVSASPLSQLVSNLGAGAAEWFKPRVPPELWDKTPILMTSNDFITLTDIFLDWPFKPDIYEEILIPSEE